MHSALKTPAPENRAEQIAREYEDFAYIVSHDLNAPLRHVREFTSLLIGGRREKLTDEECEYIRFLEKSLDRIDEMQRALLSFSRLNTRAGDVRAVDFNEAVAAAIKDLDDIIKLHFPAIECRKLPTLVAEPQQIRLLFFHLIGNALKFYDSETVKRKVIITAVDQGDVWLFEIKDNGIGIDKKYHREVLRMFRRLEPELYPGIGAGLTIARKISQRHGGELLIESEAGQGTSVFFSIAKL